MKRKELLRKVLCATISTSLLSSSNVVFADELQSQNNQSEETSLSEKKADESVRLNGIKTNELEEADINGMETNEGQSVYNNADNIMDYNITTSQSIEINDSAGSEEDNEWSEQEWKDLKCTINGISFQMVDANTADIVGYDEIKLPDYLKKNNCDLVLPAQITVGESKFKIRSVRLNINGSATSAYKTDKIIKSITISEGITSIGSLVQGSQSFEKLYIPSTVEEITMNPVINVPKLKEIVVDSDNRDFIVKDGILFSKDMTNLICYPPTMTASEYEVPKSVKEISIMAFAYNEYIKTIKILGDMTSSNVAIFRACPNLENVYFPESFKSDEYSMIFMNSKNVKKVVFYGDLTVFKDDLPNENIDVYVENEKDKLLFKNKVSDDHLKVLKDCSVSVSECQNGKIISIDGSNTAKQFKDKTYRLIPNDGYKIDQVLVDGNPVSLSDDNTYTFKEIDNDHEISATFTKALNNYTINVKDSENGTIKSIDGSNNVSEGSNKTYKITPDSGYKISQVLVDGNPVSLSNEDTYIFTNVNGNHTIEAKFEKILRVFRIYLDCGNDGTIKCIDGANDVVEGQNRTYEIVPNDGYKIEKVLVDGKEVALTNENIYTFENVDQDHTIKVIFEKSLYNYCVHVDGVDHGKIISIDGHNNVPEGGNKIYRIIPDDGYRIKEVLVDNKPVDLTYENNYVFVNVNENHTISAVFERVTSNYIITVANGENGTVESLDGSNQVAEGGNITYRVIPDYGYVIKEVLVNGEKVTLTKKNTYTFTNVTGNHTISAVFEEYNKSQGSSGSSSSTDDSSSGSSTGGSSSSTDGNSSGSSTGGSSSSSDGNSSGSSTSGSSGSSHRSSGWSSYKRDSDNHQESNDNTEEESNNKVYIYRYDEITGRLILISDNTILTHETEMKIKNDGRYIISKEAKESLKNNQFNVVDNMTIYVKDEKAVTGWFLNDNKWYHFRDNGIMDKGWLKDTDGKWYYLNDSGEMVTGWLLNDNKWYHLADSGNMDTGWLKDINDKWYYLSNSGDMDTGWVQYNRRWYYLNENGDMYSSGWKLINDKWYYFYGSGEMACSTKINGYRLGNDGAWLNK